MILNDVERDLRTIFSLLGGIAEGYSEADRKLLFTVALEELDFIVDTIQFESKNKMKELVNSIIKSVTGGDRKTFVSRLKKVKVDIPGVRSYYWDPAKHPRNELGRFTYKDKVDSPDNLTPAESRANGKTPLSETPEQADAFKEYTIEEIEKADWDTLIMPRSVPYRGIRGHITVEGITVAVLGDLTKEEFLTGIKNVKLVCDRGKELLGEKFHTEGLKVTFIPTGGGTSKFKYLSRFDLGPTESGFSGAYYTGGMDQIVLEPKMFVRDQKVAEMITFHEMIHRDNFAKKASYQMKDEEASAMLFSLAYSRAFFGEVIPLVTYPGVLVGLANKLNKKGRSIEDFLDELVDIYKRKGSTKAKSWYYKYDPIIKLQSYNSKLKSLEKLFPGLLDGLTRCYHTLGYSAPERHAEALLEYSLSYS